jgi:hypothetical protein
MIRAAFSRWKSRRNTPEIRPMLQMRPNCECCDRDLPATSPDAWICSFECTFCDRCANENLRGICPNCAGKLVPRPPRAVELLSKYPASEKRVLKPGGCTA